MRWRLVKKLGRSGGVRRVIGIDPRARESENCPAPDYHRSILFTDGAGRPCRLVTSVMNYFVAVTYAALGEKDAAFAEREKAYQARDWFLTRLKVDPFVHSLRDDQHSRIC